MRADHDSPKDPGERIGLLQGQGAPLGGYVRAYPREQRTLLRVLEDQARKRPGETWLDVDGETLTFDGAHAFTNQVAHAVLATAPEGAHVALFLRNQIEFMPCFFGPMAAGGVTVPVNGEARGPILRHIIEKSDARIVIARLDLLDRLRALDSLGAVETVVVVGGEESRPDRLHGAEVVGLEEWIGDRPTHRPREHPAHDRIAHIQFTSGTTGSSKGALYTHHYLFLCSAIVSDSLGRTADEVLMTPLPLYHVGAQHIVANSALHAGAKAVLKSSFSAGRFWEQIAECGATQTFMVGPMAGVLLKTTEPVPGLALQTVFCVPPPADVAAFERHFGVTVLWQGYGSTEVFPLPMRAEMLDGPSDTIGHPVDWMEYGVVDEHDTLLGPGEVGELVFRSLLPHAMMSGYFEDAEATVHAMRNCAFHTGDLAVYDEDGCLHYRGRMQDRLRRRGENVSAVELEEIVMGHPDVIGVAAYGLPGEFGEHDIKVDCVVRPGLTHEGLHAWLGENLPRFMVPRYLEFRESFPTTPSEKIEKYKLAALGVERPEVWDAEAHVPGRIGTR